MMLRFQPAEVSDIPVILSQAKDLVDRYEDLAAIDHEKVLAWMQQKISRNLPQYRAVTANGEKCAYFRLCPDGELDDLYVLPRFQNLGIGTQILLDCILESPEPLWLYVFSRNTGAIRFYERFGFTLREKVGDTRLILERKG